MNKMNLALGGVMMGLMLCASGTASASDPGDIDIPNGKTVCDIMDCTRPAPAHRHPVEVVKSLYAVIEAENLKAFVRMLTGDALDRFGNAAGLELLQKEAQAYDHLSFIPKTRVSDYTVIVEVYGEHRGEAKVLLRSVKVQTLRSSLISSL